MASLITNISVGRILIQTGVGVPNHVAPKGSQFTDVTTANLYINKDGIINWVLNIDTSNSGTTSNIYSFNTFSSTTVGQTFVSTSIANDTIILSGIGLNILTDDVNNVLTFSSTTGTDTFVTGGTYNPSTGIASFTNNSGSGFDVTGITDNYWTSGSTGNYSIKTKNDSGLDATGNYAVAEGEGTLASGISSHAEGGTTISSGQYSHAEGSYSLASGNQSHAEGFSTSATGITAHAEGNYTIAGGNYSHAEGNYTKAYGNQSHAEGNYTIASGNSSHAEGNYTIANGNSSHAEGESTIASGDYSHAGGDNSVASGTTSFVHSSNSFTNSDYSAILGGYNNIIPYGIINSIILGGDSITATTSGTTFVEGLNIKNTQNDNSITKLLTVDNTGLVKYRDASSIIVSDTYVTGGTYNGGTATFTNNTGGTFNVNGFYTGATDVYVTGLTFNPSNYDLTISRNDNVSFTESLAILSSDMVVTGGTYNPSTGIATFTNNSGGTFNVNGFLTGMTDTYVTGLTYSNNLITLKQNAGQPNLSILIDSMTGLTINGGFSANTISATTYYNLPITTDVFVTGGTYSNGTTVFRNNTGGTFNITGYYTGVTDVYITGATYSSNVFTYRNNTGGTFNVLFNSVTGLTVNGILSATTISGDTIYANDFPQLPYIDNQTIDYYISSGDTFIRLKESVAAPSGGTRTFVGNVNITSGLSASTISATTYYNLPTDIRVTGGTYNNGTILFTNNTGGTFNVTGLYSGGTDVYTTGATYNNNTFIYRNNTGGTFDVSFNTVTGLTVNGNLLATTISATSINKVDYIVFNTGTTSVATQAGTVYFDNIEHALSYNTSINQGVTVNLGQQNYVRVFNNSGVDIQRGKALEVLSAYSGLPSVTLAVNKHTGFNIIGVSAEIIPNNSEGIAITYGMISDIELTGITIGSFVYASDTTPGKLDDPSKYLNLTLTARTNQIGYVIQTGTTTGKLFVDIRNENSVLSLTDLERNVLEGNTLSTGLFEFTGMTTASTTTFNVALLRGWIVKNTYTYATSPDVLGIYYTGDTNIPVTNIASADSTYILINSGLTITQQVTFPTPQQRRENIYLGKINHPNRTSILNINNQSDYDVSPMSSLRDLWSPIRLINQGIIPSPNGANLSFNTSAGTLWGNGINWHNNQLSPNNVNITAKVPASFFYRTQTGGSSGSVTIIDPRNYDVGGVITSIGNANLDDATNQRIYMYPTGVINVLYGQTKYASLAAAVAAVQSEVFIPYPNAESTGILIGVLSVRNDIGTDGQSLTNTNYAKFTFVSKFGESFGGTGGLSTTTLQQAYDNSSSPEITINSILDGLTIKNGTGNADNITRLIEGVNSSNNVTTFIRADGYISGTTFQSNSFIANNGGATATTFNILTLGSGTPLTNLGVDINGRVVSGTTGGSTFTGGAVTGATNFTNGLTANTISATTYYNLPIDVRVTGGTYNGANITFVNNTGGTFNVTGLTASGFSSNYYGSFSDTTTQPVTGINTPTVWTYNTTELSNGISVVNSSQIKVTNKGVYEIGYSAQLEKTQGTSADATIWAAINGNPVTRSSSITSFVSNSVIQLPFVSYIFELEANDYVEFYFSSPSDHIQLSTYSGLTSPTRPIAPSVIIVAKQVGLSVTDNLGGYYLPLSGGTVTGGTIFNNGITATTISATTYYNLPTDVRVTGGTYSNTTGITTFTNNTGGTFNVIGYYTGYNALTGATYNNNVITFTNNTGITSSLLINTMTGLTINGNLTVTGGTQSLFSGNSSSEMVRIIQTGSGDAFVVEDAANDSFSHFVINASGNVAIGLTQPLGSDKLTVSGDTSIYGGLSATTISATTYYNLPDSELDTKIFGYRVNSAAQKAYKMTQNIAGSTMTTGTINGESIYCQKFYAQPNEKINEIVFRIMTAGAAGLGLAQARILIYRSKLNANNEIIGGDLELDTNVNINTLSTGLKVITGLNYTLSNNTYKNVWFMCIRNYQTGSLSLKFYTTADIVSKLYDISASSSATERDLGWYFSTLYTSATPASMPVSASTSPSTTAVASTSGLVAIGYSNY